MSRKIEDKNKGKKNNNSGFTLIEMVVTVAIIAIFAGVILTLITNGSNSYRNTSNNAKVQMDTQELLDEIEDLIIDTNRSVYYFAGSSTEVDSAPSLGSDMGQNNSGTKTFLVCNEYENGDGTSQYIVDALEWRASDQKIYYSRTPYIDASSSVKEEAVEKEAEGGVAEFSSEDNSVNDEALVTDETDGVKNVSRPQESTEKILSSVYAEGVVNFNADVTKVESDRVVRFELTTDSGGKEIETIYTVNLRNKIQVQKPSDAFSKAPSQDLFIEIRNNPISMEAGGEPVRLRYEVGPEVIPGELDIDPSTVRWTVVSGPGSFPEEDPTSGKLTADANGSGKITVKVSAVTIKGVPIESSPVDILVINKKQPSDLEPSTGAVLIGAGNSADLNDLVSWKQKYDDGSVGEDDVKVNWSADCGFAKVTEDGQITIGAEAGTETTGSFTVTGTNPETGSKGTVTVNVARIDIAEIGEVTSNANISYKAIYMEAGRAYEITGDISYVNNHKITWGLVNKKNDEEYTPTNKSNFTKADNGTWSIKVEVNLDTGKIFSSKEFMVNITEAGYKIVGPSLVTADETYQVWRDWQVIDTSTGDKVNSPTVWPVSIENSSDVEKKSSDWEIIVDIYIGRSAENFTIKIGVPDWLWDKAGVKYLTYDVKVVKLLGIDPSEATKPIGSDVTLTPNITVGGSAANDEAKKQLTYNWALNNKPQEWGQSANWTIGDDALKENRISLQIKMPDGKNVYCPNKGTDRTETSIITVDYAVDFSLIAKNDYKKIVAGESAAFTSQIRVNGETPQDLSKYPVTWKCEKIDGKGASIDVPDVLEPSGNLAGEQTTFKPESFGKYKISASVEAFGQTFEAEPYEINVDEIKFSIKQKDHIKDMILNSDLAFYPELVINGKTPDNLEDYNIDWKCEEIKGDEEYQLNNNLIERTDNGTLNFKPTNRGKYKLSAIVTVDGREFPASYVVDVHEVKFEVRETLNKRSAVLGEALNFWLYLEIDGKEVSSTDERFTIVWNQNSVVNGAAIPGQQNRIKYTIPQDAPDTVSASASLTAFGQQTFQSQYNITVTKLKVNIIGDVYQQIYLDEDETFLYDFDAVVMESVNGAGQNDGDKDVTANYPVNWSLKLDNDELSAYIRIDHEKGEFSIDSNNITEPFIVEIKVQLKDYEEIFDTRIIYVFPKETLRETVYIGQDEEESLNCPGVPKEENVNNISLVVRYDDKHIEYPSVSDFKGFTIIQGEKIPLKIKMSNNVNLLKTISSIDLSLNFDTKLFVYTIIPQFYNVYHGHSEGPFWASVWVVDEEPAHVYIPSPETLLMMGSRVDSYTYSWVEGSTRCELRQSSSGYAGRGLWIIKYQDNYYAYVEGKWEQRPLGWFWFLKAIVSRKL
ncbi:prepilin-type N-terminal cleavage/methylation domain-containing protein [Blautia schinkii]|nr:prepilin-type N-terminal cleavage/methylation domain-containing protein [Blautia schinkii]